METRKVDSIGRITIPKDIREKLDIQTNEELQVRLQGKSIIIARPGDEEGQAVSGQAPATFKKLKKGTPEFMDATETHMIHCNNCDHTGYGRLFKTTEKLRCKECGSEISFAGKKRITVECPDCNDAYELTVPPGTKKVECRKCGRKIKIK